MSKKEYFKGFGKFFLIGVLLIGCYVGFARLLNWILSPGERAFLWYNWYLVLIPIALYFGAYGLYKVNYNLNEKERLWSKFQHRKTISMMFYITCATSIVLQSFLAFITFFFGTLQLVSPNEARGFGVFMGLIQMLLFAQTISGGWLLAYYFIRRKKLKDRMSYFLFGSLINLIAILYFLTVYYPAFVRNFSFH